MIGDYMSVNEAAEKWDLTIRMVQKLCADDRIEGVKRFGKSWAIPINAERPIDRRIRNGNWIGYRNRQKMGGSNKNKNEVINY